MSLRILGGQAKGLEIQVPKADMIRPTSVLLRRKLFDSYQNLEDYSFIDLCAGTGAMGLEALSRKAYSAWFYEKNSKVFNILKHNIEAYRSRVKSEQVIHIFKQDFTGFFPIQSNQDKRLILYFDPPYEQKQLYEQLALLTQDLKGNIELWVESDRQKGFKQEELELLFPSPRKVFTQGTSYLSIIDKG